MYNKKIQDTSRPYFNADSENITHSYLTSLKLEEFTQAEFSYSDDHRVNRCTTNLTRRADCGAPRIKIITPACTTVWSGYNVTKLQSRQLFWLALIGPNRAVLQFCDCPNCRTAHQKIRIILRLSPLGDVKLYFYFYNCFRKRTD
jgi:hypothetical protein